MTISDLPNVLVLHLKRFSFGNMFGKVTRHIQFLPVLNFPVSKFTNNKEQNKFDLTGVIVHHGHSTHSGHYVAYIKAANGVWYEMDDSNASVVSINTVLKAQAYVLFYTRKGQPKAVATPVSAAPAVPPGATATSFAQKVEKVSNDIDKSAQPGKVQPTEAAVEESVPLEAPKSSTATKVAEPAVTEIENLVNKTPIVRLKKRRPWISLMPIR
jgi:hypothetical protein